MLALVLLAISAVALYLIIRKAVMHGILDADEARRGRDRADRLQETLRTGTSADAPRS